MRPLTEQDELAEAVRLQREIWGFEEIDLLPVRLFAVALKIGGQVLGAFDQNRMIGFLLAMPGLKPGGVSYLHSQMMGVLPAYRNLGLGKIMKLRQREDALRQGLDLIEWTFDPLEIKNAFFNIERLGAIVRRYVRNQYGTTTSPLHGGLPTDRCVAEWHIRRAWVEDTLRGARNDGRQSQMRIEVPNDIDEIRQNDTLRARAVQERISDAFEDAFSRDLVVIGFERGPVSGAYLLGSWASS